MSQEQAIGVFDSGVGGLSVLAKIRRHLPHEALIYIADSKYMPYGCKPECEVQTRCMAIAAFFEQRRCKAMVIACNTATAVAVHQIRDACSFPVIGMEPAVKPAVLQSKSHVIGVLATRGTAGSHKFNRLASRFAHQAQIIVQPCPGLVERIEAGDLAGRETRLILESFLLPLMREGMDTLVLGCTHYPFVMPLIRDIIGDEIAIIDSGGAIARELQRQLACRHLLTENNHAQVEFWASGDAGVTVSTISRLWGDKILLRSLPF